MTERPVPAPGSPFGKPPAVPALPEYDEMGIGGGLPQWVLLVTALSVFVIVFLLMYGGGNHG